MLLERAYDKASKDKTLNQQTAETTKRRSDKTSNQQNVKTTKHRYDRRNKITSNIARCFCRFEVFQCFVGLPLELFKSLEIQFLFLTADGDFGAC